MNDVNTTCGIQQRSATKYLLQIELDINGDA